MSGIGTVCDKKSQTVLLVIELDDKTHFQFNRKKRDKEVDEILASQQIPILHIPVKPLYDTVKLRKDIYAKIQLPLQWNHDSQNKQSMTESMGLQ